MTDCVIVLHGIFRTRHSMAGLARYLRKQGFEVLNLGYPSTRLSLEELAEHIHPAIQEFLKGKHGRVHFVGYSMGGLLIRAYLHRYGCAHLGRIAMLGTPNHGSEVADYVKDWRLYRWLYGKAGQQLVTGALPLRDYLKEAPCELGIIAGNRSLDFISSRIIGKPGDGKVSIESTKLAGMKEHLILPVTHTFFPHTREVWRQTAHFLRHGTFNSDA